MSVSLTVLIGMGETSTWAKGSRHASNHHHRHHAQRSHHKQHKHKVHPKNPTRRPKHHKPKHHVKAHPKPMPVKHPVTPVRRTVTTRLPSQVTVAKKPADKPRDRVRDVRRFVNFNERTGEYWFDNYWWHNFVVYPTTVSRSEAFTANYNTLVPPANITVKPPVIKANETLPLAPAGSSLAVMLDRMDVEHRWLPGQTVAWRTGDSVDPARGPASNAGAFVAAAGAQLKVPMPLATDDNLLAASQHDWLVNEGVRKGWVEVGAMEAQLLANQGWLVVAAWKDGAAKGEKSLAGQTAIVRPSRKPAADIAANGPHLTEAGPHNHNDISLKDGFPSKAIKQVVFLAHRPG
jgi:hypothetical protein